MEVRKKFMTSRVARRLEKLLRGNFRVSFLAGLKK